MSDYTIVGEDAVKHCLEALRPYLKMKKRQATLLLQIIEQSQKEEEPVAFLTRCKLVDQISRLNDSKTSKKRNTSKTAQKHTQRLQNAQQTHKIIEYEIHFRKQSAP